MPGKYRNNRNKGSIALVGVLAAILVVLLGVALWISGLQPEPGPHIGASSLPSSTPVTSQSQPLPTTIPTVSTAPPVVKISTATLVNTGDILMHNPIINNNYDAATGTYEFARSFRFFTPYVSAADFAVANLETTLAGNDNGYGYSGYPLFNCPDRIAQNLKDAGFDLLLTANNHTYDTRGVGFHRTQQVLQSVGLEHLGTVSSEEQPLWQVHEINGIKIGMLCYTYETKNDYTDRISLNGIVLTPEDSRLIGSFRYDRLDVFYDEVRQHMQAMQDAGAEAVVFYIHWGDEYRLTQNSYQDAIAQQLCDLGVDVIVGGHPHVVQPMELLTSTVDDTHKTVCLYSMGNALSNQRLEYMDPWDPQNTEDGLLFSFTFAKYSDGTVILESTDILPMWVNHYINPLTGRFVYEILPLDKQLADWTAAFELTPEGLADTLASYDRTMAIVGTGLEQIRTYLAGLVTETEAAIGVTK